MISSRLVISPEGHEIPLNYQQPLRNNPITPQVFAVDTTNIPPHSYLDVTGRIGEVVDENWEEQEKN